MATAESAGKTCIVCGKDVSGQPRVKDAAGHYMCAGECQQKAIAAAQARKDAAAQPKPAPRGPTLAKKPASSEPLPPGGLLGQLIDESPMLKSAKCESCGSAMPGGSVICTRCGFNTQTGKALKTAVIIEKEKKDPGASAKKIGVSMQNGWVIFGVAAAISMAAGFMPLISLDFALPAIIVLAVLGLAAFATVASAVYEEGSGFMIAVFFALRAGQRFLARMGSGGAVAAGICELALVAYVMFFVENVLAKALTAAACLGWLCLGVSAGLLGKTIETLVGL